MGKKITVINDVENKRCPITKDTCQYNECAWIHTTVIKGMEEDFWVKKCSIEAIADNLHKI